MSVKDRTNFDSSHTFIDDRLQWYIWTRLQFYSEVDLYKKGGFRSKTDEKGKKIYMNGFDLRVPTEGI